MTNLTKLFCDLLSAGSQLGDTTVPTEQIVNHLKYVAFQRLPEGCDADLEAIAEHIEDVRSALRGSDHDIDDVRTRLAQGKPVSIKRIVDFHNKLTVTLSDDRQLSFNTMDIVHY